MKLAEIDEKLPNGFHDAEIEQLNWNFEAGLLIFDINFWVAVESGHDRNKRRKGKLELQKVSFLVIEPPELRMSDPKPLRGGVGALQVDGGPANEENFRDLSKLKANLSADTEIFSFYVVNWNSFIHVATDEAKLTWFDNETS